MVVKQKIKNAIIIVVLAALFGSIIYGMVMFAKQQEEINKAKFNEMVAKMEKMIEEYPPLPIQLILSLPDPDDFEVTQLTHKQVVELKNVSIRNKVLMHLDAELPGDDLVTVEGDVQAKRSNVEGILIEGETYYYAVFPDASFDPWTLLKVKEKEVDVIDTIDFQDCSVKIYRINKGGSK